MIQQLKAQDAQFLYLQSGGVLTQVMAVFIYDPSTAPGGVVRFEDVVRHVESRLDTSPLFRRKLHRLPFDIDHPYWVDDPHFDVEAHISHAALPEPRDWRQLRTMAARHFSKPIDMARPLWDMLVVEGLDQVEGVAPGSFALFYRIHHAAIDGVSAMYAFAALHDRDARGTPAVEAPASAQDLGEKPDAQTVMSRAWSANLASPVKMVEAVMKLSPALVSAAQARLTSPDAEKSSVPQTRFNAPITPHRVFDAASFALDDLVTIRSLAEGATINDVVLAICGGALRRYLDEHGELPESSLVAYSPINARTSASEAAVPGNVITAMAIRLGTDIADHAARLEAIHRFARDAKEAKAGLSARVITDLTKAMPGTTLAAVSRLLTSERFAPRQANALVSNVPGSRDQMYLAGARMTQQFGLGPIAHNMGLFIVAMSYAGTISFSITSDREMLPDIDGFRWGIEQVFAEMLEAARTAPAAKAARRPRAAEKPIRHPRTVARPAAGAR